MTNSARDRAVEIVRTLRDAGKTAYLAGGCVRDELLGLTPTDYDVATDATPDQIARIFPRTSLVGAAFGVVLVHQGKGKAGKGRTTEVATFRTDIGYGDKRRPDRIEFTDAEHDAQRRDFTINALFLDPLETGSEDDGGEAVPAQARVIDYVDGRRDLEARIVRAVGEPSRRLDEDHLRALRAVRFACRLGFDLDPATADAIRAHASELTGVSKERVGEELRKMLAHPARARAVRMIDDLGLDTPTLGKATVPVSGPESGPVSGAASGTGPGMAPDATPPGGGDTHDLLARLDPDASFPLALSTLALERHGRQPTAHGAADAIVRWRRSLCLSNEERDACARILETLMLLRAVWFKEPVARQKRIAMARSFPDAHRLLRAVDPARADRVQARLAELEAIGMGLDPDPLLDGEALIGLGLAPGPDFARILNGVYDGQLDGRVTDSDSALALARELAASFGVQDDT